MEATYPQSTCNACVALCPELYDIKIDIDFFFPVQTLNDWHLALGVMILVFVDLTILKIYTLVERFQGNLSAIRVPNRENPRDELGVS